MSKMAKRLQRTLTKDDRGEAVFSLSPLGDRGEPRPGLRNLVDAGDAIAWEEAQAAAQPKVSINLRVRPEVLDFFRGDDPRGYQRRINAVLEAYARGNRGSYRPKAAAAGRASGRSVRRRRVRG